MTMNAGEIIVAVLGKGSCVRFEGQSGIVVALGLWSQAMYLSSRGRIS